MRLLSPAVEKENMGSDQQIPAATIVTSTQIRYLKHQRKHGSKHF